MSKKHQCAGAGGSKPFLSSILPSAYTINGLWVLQKRIGHGGFGEVWTACMAGEEDLVVAVKLETKSSSRRSFLAREIDFLNKIGPALDVRSAKYFPVLLDSGLFSYKQADFRYMVLEYIEGGDLNQLIKSMEFRNPYYNLTLAYNMLLAIKAIHQNGFLHCDVKPHNFLLGKNKKMNFDDARKRHTGVLLLDFGLVKRVTPQNLLASSNTSSAGQCTNSSDSKSQGKINVAGTPKYMSLFTHLTKENDYRDDLVSLVYIFAELCHVRLPWSNTDKTKLVEPKQQWDMKDCPVWVQTFYQALLDMNPFQFPPYPELEKILFREINLNKKTSLSTLAATPSSKVAHSDKAQTDSLIAENPLQQPTRLRKSRNNKKILNLKLVR